LPRLLTAGFGTNAAFGDVCSNVRLQGQDRT
jgi:hypothetical protein